MEHHFALFTEIICEPEALILNSIQFLQPNYNDLLGNS